MYLYMATFCISFGNMTATSTKTLNIYVDNIFNYHCSINTSWFCVSDTECTSKVTLKDLLTFITAADHIPPTVTLRHR